VTLTRLVPREPEVVAPGAVHLPGWLDPGGQRDLADACRQWSEQAGGFRSPRMPRGGTMSVQITCLGWHWFPYRYSRTVDDGDGRPVAPFPTWLGDLSRRALADAAATLDVAVVGQDAAGALWPADGYRPDVALVNWYAPGAHMGMHADREEASPAPVVSLSLGDSCVFRFGTAATRGRPWVDVVLESGDLFVFGGPSRRAYHGVPRLLPGTADPALGPGDGRINLTVRQTGLPG
jgi:alkylated DNA repair protein (DNA oxidative demethylase)